MAEVVWAILAALVVALGAWAGWCLARPPRCPRCRSRTEAQPAELLAQCPPVFRIAFRCPGCAQVVAHRAMGTWD